MARSRTLLAASLAFALAPAAAAQAAPHWSSPQQVVAAPSSPTQSVGAPQALAAPGGGFLGFGSDGTAPIALAGTVGGGLQAAKLPGAGGGAATGAVGPDGTRAAVWTQDGRGRLAVAPPGAAFLGPVELPGEGVNAADVAIGPEGTITVAWRTRAAGGPYAVNVAQAPAGGALGAPVVLESGSAAVNTVDVAAGPGAVAVAFNRIASVYRAKVAVQRAGGAFEAPQAVSASTAPDIGPKAVVEADGTVVAAWGNGQSGGLVQRGPGETAFGAVQPLGPAFDVDLQPTPQGGSALAFVGGGKVRAAVRVPGGAFAPADVTDSPGAVVQPPSIAVDAAGTPYVLTGTTEDGAVRVVSPSGTKVLGYGKAGTGTAVSLAAGAANRAVALFQDAQGGLSAATFGEDAPADQGPGKAPAAADRTTPKLTVLSKRRVAVTRRTTSVRLKVRFSEDVRLGTSGTLRTTKGGKRRIAPLAIVGVSKGKAYVKGTRTVTIALGAAGRKDLRAAIAAKRGATLFLRLEAQDAAGNSTTKRVELSLRATR